MTGRTKITNTQEIEMTGGFSVANVTSVTTTNTTLA